MREGGGRGKGREGGEGEGSRVRTGLEQGGGYIRIG